MKTNPHAVASPDHGPHSTENTVLVTKEDGGHAEEDWAAMDYTPARRKTPIHN